MPHREVEYEITPDEWRAKTSGSLSARQRMVPLDSRIPEIRRVGAAASPMFHRHKTDSHKMLGVTTLRSSRRPCPVALLTARPRRAARCRFRRFVTVRNSTRRARRTTEGARHARLRTRKGCGPPGATRSFFARPRPDRGAGLARSRARAGERPGTAETGERPTSRSAVRTPYRGERALHERRCQTPRFPAERDAFVGRQILSPES
jgi:hypothetical protein